MKKTKTPKDYNFRNIAVQDGDKEVEEFHMYCQKCGLKIGVTARKILREWLDKQEQV